MVLDGGGPSAERTEAIAGAMEVTDARVVRLSERDLGEPLSVFPLTVWVQRIALELAEARGVSPDRFRYEEDPAREQRRVAGLRSDARGVRKSCGATTRFYRCAARACARASVP